MASEEKTEEGADGEAGGGGRIVRYRGLLIAVGVAEALLIVALVVYFLVLN